MAREIELDRMVVRLVGDGSRYYTMLARAEEHTSRFVAAVIGATGVITGLGAAFSAIQRSASFETMEIEFGTLLQDVEKGKTLIADIQDLAAKTPMTMPGLLAGAKQLLQANVAVENIIPLMRMLGDVVGGDEERFARMSYAFNNMATAGRLMGQDLMQMMNAGFNPLQEISRTTGKSMGELRKQMEAGGITVGMVVEAFKSATAEGGRFHNGMENASKGLGGLFSTLKDDAGMALKKLGDELVEGFQLKALVRNVSEFAQAVGRWVQFLGPKVRAFGTDVLDATGKWIANNKQLLVTLGLVAGGVTLAVVTVKALTVALGLLEGLFLALKLDLVVQAALWVAWTGVVLLAKATTWLFNVALTVMNALLGTGLVATFAAFIAVAGVFVATMILIGSALYAAYEAGRAVVDVLGEMPTDSGPLGAVADTLGEWGTLLRNFVEYARKDAPLAFEYLKTSGQLAVSQLKDLWPPLWAFVVEGWGALSDAAATEFELRFYQAVANVSNKFLQIFLALTPSLAAPFQAAVNRMNEAINQSSQKSLDLARRRLRDAVKNFKVTDSAETQQLRDVLEFMDQMFEEMGDPAAKVKDDLGAWPDGIEKATKELHKFDSALFGSAEAASRIAEYTAKLDQMNAGVTRQARQGPGFFGRMAAGIAAGHAGEIATARSRDSVLDDIKNAGGFGTFEGSTDAHNQSTILEDIREINRQMLEQAKNVPLYGSTTIQPANLES